MTTDHERLAVDIRPESDIYQTYRRLSYQPWYAIAEFVDNSTGNFETFRQAIEDATGDVPVLRVDIFYDRDEGTLSVIDNAHGMGLEEFRRALQLAKPPKNTDGRSEFGMGLKTACCWLGPRWRVVSKQLGSSEEYSAFVDVARLRSDKPSSLEIDVRRGVEPSLHYTRVEVEGLTEYDRVFRGKTLGKIKSEIASIYRRDLKSGSVRITFNGDSLAWDQPALLTERAGDAETIWRKQLEFEVGGKKVGGWIGILAKGKAAHGGFDIFRRGRLITGGPGQGWKPWEIFGAPNSFQSQRLTGEIDLDRWRSSHTKDRIDWSGSDEHELTEHLRQLSLDYIAKARESRRDDGKATLSRTAVESVVEESREELEDSDELGTQIAIVEQGILPEVDTAETELVDGLISDLGDSISIKFGGTAFPTLTVALTDDGATTEPLVRVGFPADDEISMILNLRHPFIESFVGDSEKALKVMVHMLYVDALVERLARRSPDLSPAQLRGIKDQFLRHLQPID